MHLFLAHLSRRLKVSYCDHPLSSSSVHNLYTTSPPKPLIGFWPNLTGMILGWSSFKVIQMVSVLCISRSQELKIDFLTKNLKKFSCQKPLDWFQYNVPLVILYQDFSSQLDSSKNMATRGRGLFSLYIYIENFKKLLVRNHWTDFNIILQKCFFGDPLPRLFQPFGFVKKHGCQGAGLIFPIYLYRKL